MTREAVVAGMFYEGDAAGLTESIAECFAGRLGPGEKVFAAERRRGSVVGLVCPHAGYFYSGSAAAWAYSALAEDGLPDVAVILGPNHTGLGPAVSVSAENEWITPLGKMRVDAEARESILRGCEYASADDLAHSREHSIEVQLPFLQYIGASECAIVPISIAHLNAHDALIVAQSLGRAVAGALEGRNAVVIASTDFSHYISKASASAKDSRAMGRIESLDAEELISTVYGEDMTMCGVIGTAVMIEACRAMGATKARRLTYYTSGDVTGDIGSVVGYGAMVVEKEVR